MLDAVEHGQLVAGYMRIPPNDIAAFEPLSKILGVTPEAAKEWAVTHIILPNLEVAEDLAREREAVGLDL